MCGEWAAGPGHPEPSPSQQPPPLTQAPLGESGVWYSGQAERKKWTRRREKKRRELKS